MNYRTVEAEGKPIAILEGNDVLLTDVQSALDLMATITFTAGTTRIVVNKAQIGEDFFDLSTKLAGEILQKMINYQVKIAIVGDFSGYTSKSLQDFIRECNRGQDIFFVPDEQQAIARLVA